MDPQLICGVSSQVDDILDTSESELNSKNRLRKLDLQWSGNTAVLRAWSEPEGLPSLPHLETVNIIVPTDTVVSESACCLSFLCTQAPPFPKGSLLKSHSRGFMHKEVGTLCLSHKLIVTVVRLSRMDHEEEG